MLTQKADIFSGHNVVNGTKINTNFFRENYRKVSIFLDYIFKNNWRFINVRHSRVKLKQPELIIDKFRELFRILN